MTEERYDVKMFLLKQELNKFLDEHPELKPMQAEIDNLLAGAGSQHNRNVFLSYMMRDKLLELKGKLVELNGVLDKAARGIQ